MLFIILGIIGVLGGCFAVYARNDRLKNAKPYVARMVSIESKLVMTGAVLRKVYRAVVSYKGDRMEERAHHHSFVYYDDYKERFDLSDEFIVYVDPRIRDVFYFPQEMKGVVSFGALALLLVGAFFIVAGIILASRGM